jgi:hypothetical protein
VLPADEAAAVGTVEIGAHLEETAST